MWLKRRGDLGLGRCFEGRMCDWTLHTAESRGEKCTVCTDHSGVGVGKLVVFVMFGHMHVFFGSDIGVRSQASQTVCDVSHTR